MRAYFLLVITLFFFGCDSKSGEKLLMQENKELLIYCGITMVNPIAEIARIIEQEKDVKIKISQGGSKDIYDAMKHNKIGDIYFPGTEEFIVKNRADGFFEKEVFVGYNKAVMVVKKGNPKGVQLDINELLSKKYRVLLSSPHTGSIGRETEIILKSAGIYDKAIDNAIHVATDSRRITEYLLSDKADIAINWAGAIISNGATDRLDAIDIDEKYAKKHNMYMVLLSFSKEKELARYFMEVASSQRGREIFERHGFR